MHRKLKRTHGSATIRRDQCDRTNHTFLIELNVLEVDRVRKLTKLHQTVISHERTIIY